MDTTVINFHRVPSGGLVVSDIVGGVARVLDNGRRTAPLGVGDVLAVGDTISVDPDSRLIASDVVLSGGANGRAHSFVGDDAFKPKPSKDDVPEILAQLRRARELPVGDPYRNQRGPHSPYERAASAEFARINLDGRFALELSEETARSLRAVPLFMSEHSAFVAMDSVDSTRVMALIVELACPVNPHLVERAVLDELLARVFD